VPKSTSSKPIVRNPKIPTRVLPKEQIELVAPRGRAQNQIVDFDKEYQDEAEAERKKVRDQERRRKDERNVGGVSGEGIFQSAETRAANKRISDSMESDIGGRRKEKGRRISESPGSVRSNSTSTTFAEDPSSPRRRPRPSPPRASKMPRIISTKRPPPRRVEESDSLSPEAISPPVNVMEVESPRDDRRLQHQYPGERNQNPLAAEQVGMEEEEEDGSSSEGFADDFE
jgi:hypothetical protein